MIFFSFFFISFLQIFVTRENLIVLVDYPVESFVVAYWIVVLFLRIFFARKITRKFSLYLFFFYAVTVITSSRSHVKTTTRRLCLCVTSSLSCLFSLIQPTSFVSCRWCARHAQCKTTPTGNICLCVSSPFAHPRNSAPTPFATRTTFLPLDCFLTFTFNAQKITHTMCDDIFYCYFFFVAYMTMTAKLAIIIKTMIVWFLIGSSYCLIFQIFWWYIWRFNF